MNFRRYRQGDAVIYRVEKHTTCPGPRARDVRPDQKGDYYRYVVDKFWCVAEVLADNKLRLVTRRGKEHIVQSDDPQLRRPSWWESLIYRRRFPPTFS